MKWSEQVASKGGGPQSIPTLLELHKKRWAEWENYMIMLKGEGFEEQRRDDLIWEDSRKKFTKYSLEYNFVVVLEKSNVAWSKRYFVRDDDHVLLDAGFGSVSWDSDLDVNVVSTTPEVVTMWMSFTREFVKSTGAADSFCEYWDSNFYYQPGVLKSVKIARVPEYLTVVPFTKVLVDKGFAWTTGDTALFELSCVKAYCDAYESRRSIVIDDRVSTPNPENMTEDVEQECYASSLYFAEKFREACESGTDDEIRYAYLKYAVTKVEGLVSVVSLAVCDVFGKQVNNDFFMKERKGAYVKSPYVAGISAYEMLRNLRMHSKNVEGVLLYKTKYANRLMYALNTVKGLCNICTSNRRDLIRKDSGANLNKIKQAMTVMLDFMDGIDTYNGNDGKCLYVDNVEWVDKLETSLDVLCDRAYDYVEGLIKEETSEKKKGTDYVKELIES